MGFLLIQNRSVSCSVLLLLLGAGSALAETPRPGQTAASGCEQLTYQVQPGDTFDAIARDRALPVAAVLAANPGLDPESLQIDQTIQLPVPTACAPESPTAAVPERAAAPAIVAQLSATVASALTDRPDLWIGGGSLLSLLGLAYLGQRWRRRWLGPLVSRPAEGDLGRSPLASSAAVPLDLPLEITPVSAAAIVGGVAIPSAPSRPVVRPPAIAPPPERPAPPAPPEEHWSGALQNVLNQPPASLPSRMMLGGVMFFVVFGTWAWFGHIEESGKGRGRLIPEGEAYKLHAIEMGRIARLAVQEGQSVKKGEIIVELDTELAQQDLARLQQTLMAYQTELLQKQGLREQMESEAQSRAQMSAADLQAQETSLLEARNSAETFRRLLEQLKGDAAAQGDRLERLQPLADDGAISREHLFDLEQSLRDRRRSITQSQGDLARSLSEAERLEALLRQKQAEAQAVQAEAQQRIESLQVELTQIKAKMTETQGLITSAQTKLKQRFVYAPIDGVVLSLNVDHAGEVLQPGQTIAAIAPSDAPLVLQAALPNPEAGFVKIGMPVKVKIDAYPFQDYGVVPGHVVALSPDTKQDEQMGPVYEVKVALDRNHVIEGGRSITFKPGQTAQADIVIRRRRILDILLDPIRQLQRDTLSR